MKLNKSDLDKSVDDIIEQSKKIDNLLDFDYFYWELRDKLLKEFKSRYKVFENEEEINSITSEIKSNIKDKVFKTDEEIKEFLKGKLKKYDLDETKNCDFIEQYDNELYIFIVDFFGSDYSLRFEFERVNDEYKLKED